MDRKAEQQELLYLWAGLGPDRGQSNGRFDPRSDGC